MSDLEQYTLIRDAETFRKVLSEIGEAGEIAVDIESGGLTKDDALNPWSGYMVGVGFAWRKAGKKYINDMKAAYLPFRTEDQEYIEAGGKVFNPKQTLNLIYEATEESEPTWFMHNAKFDLKWLEMACDHYWDCFQIRDTMLEMWMWRVDESRGLKDVVQRFYPEREPPVKFTDLLGRGKKKKRIEEVDLGLVAQYCMDDCVNTFLIGDVLYKNILEESPATWNAYIEQELPILRVLTDMETHGVKIDKAALEELAQSLYKKQKELSATLKSYSDINWNSNKQLIPFLESEGIKLPNIKTAKGAQKLDREILLSIEDQHPAIPALLDIKEVNKLIGTYVEGFYNEMDDYGRIHCDFRQTGTRTGRLSCSKPNLQNIPADSFKKKGSRLYQEYKKLRELFVGEYNTPLIQADLSQIEMRIAAHFSADPALMDIYLNDKDLHQYTSDRVTKGDRTLAKNVNFGFLYGQRARGLSNITDLTMNEAKVFIAQFEKTYRGLLLWTKREEARARINGYVETITGRRRYLPNIKDENWFLASEAARQGINTIIQGSAADYLKTAMLMIDEEITAFGYKMVLQIHDELVFSPIRELSEKEVADASEFIKDCLENAMKLNVPIKAEPKVVWSWAEAK